MGHMIPPEVQVSEVRDPLRISRGGPVKIEQQAKTFKILADILVGRITSVECQPGRELGLDCGSHRRWDGRRTKLGALGVKVPTKTLEMPADQHHVSLKHFMGESRHGRRGGRRIGRWRDNKERGTMCVRISESWSTVIVPAGQCGRGHGRNRKREK